LIEGDLAARQRNQTQPERGVRVSTPGQSDVRDLGDDAVSRRSPPIFVIPHRFLSHFCKSFSAVQRHSPVEIKVALENSIDFREIHKTRD
jgi:hypothetical protein